MNQEQDPYVVSGFPAQYGIGLNIEALAGKEKDLQFRWPFL